MTTLFLFLWLETFFKVKPLRMLTPEKQTPDLWKAPAAPNMDKVELNFAVNVALRNCLHSERFKPWTQWRCHQI